jgi:hypothetical protein
MMFQKNFSPQKINLTCGVARLLTRKVHEIWILKVH